MDNGKLFQTIVAKSNDLLSRMLLGGTHKISCKDKIANTHTNQRKNEIKVVKSPPENRE